ncbi:MULTISPECIES: hypothetical protein [Pseudomonas]|uniref:hypothetical protein n=1 Tax=Pseudomonas TaxID=286 RepID=UPI0012DFEF11|nr:MULTISPECIES: hypothetical protein [Pseudomonas]
MTLYWNEGLLITPYDDPPDNDAGYIGGGFHRGMGATAPHQAINYLRYQNEKHYQSNKSEVSAHYVSPESDNYITDGMIGFLIPEMAALPGLIADITKETMRR